VGWVGGTMKAEIATAVDFLVSKLMAQVNEMRIHTRLHVACAGHVSPTLSPLLLCPSIVAQGAFQLQNVTPSLL
jgi:hypothetical protein